MLIQKRKTSRRMISLWLGLFAIVLIAGLFVYQNFFSTSTKTPTTNTNSGIKRLNVPKTLGTQTFSDPRLNSLEQSTRSTKLYADQQSVLVDTDNSIASPSALQVYDPGYGGKLFISWTSSPDTVTGYSLYRASTNSPEYKKIASFDSKTTNYTDSNVANDQEYSYKVSAEHQTTLGVLQNIVVGKTVSMNSNSLKAEATVNGITGGGNYLTWTNPVEKKSNQPFSFKAVEIMRQRGADQLVLTTLVDSNSALAYTDADGQSSDVYQISWFASYAVSPFSSTSSGQPHDITPPLGPSDTKVTNVGDGKSIVLTWTNPLDTDFDYVRIYRSTRQGLLGTPIKDTQLKNDIQFKDGADQCLEDTQLQAEGDCFVDTAAVQGTTYYYTFTSVDKNKNESTARIIQPFGNTSPFGTL